MSERPEDDPKWMETKERLRETELYFREAPAHELLAAGELMYARLSQLRRAVDFLHQRMLSAEPLSGERKAKLREIRKGLRDDAIAELNAIYARYQGLRKAARSRGFAIPSEVKDESGAAVDARWKEEALILLEFTQLEKKGKKLAPFFRSMHRWLVAERRGYTGVMELYKDVEKRIYNETRKEYSGRPGSAFRARCDRAFISIGLETPSTPEDWRGLLEAWSELDRQHL